MRNWLPVSEHRTATAGKTVLTISEHQAPIIPRYACRTDVLFFETGALAPGVTVEEADFDMLLLIWVSNTKVLPFILNFITGIFRILCTDGPVPLTSITDKGYTLQVLYMACAKDTVCIWREFHDLR